LVSELTNEIMSEPTRAFQNESTEKPSMKVAANQNNMALMTKVNRPRVKILIGIVKINNTGRTKMFNKPSIMAAIKAG
jgi:hypothetical protein